MKQVPTWSFILDEFSQICVSITHRACEVHTYIQQARIDIAHLWAARVCGLPWVSHFALVIPFHPRFCVPALLHARTSLSLARVKERRLMHLLPDSGENADIHTRTYIYTGGFHTYTHTRRINTETYMHCTRLARVT